ncbi:MAG: S8 family serine peptidase [Bacteroidota bacterium]
MQHGNKYFTINNFLLIAFCLSFSSAASQTNSYLIFFKDKVGTSFNLSEPQAFLSEKAIQRRTKQNISINERDLPVSEVYLDSISALGGEIIYTTKWLNGALIEANNGDILSTIKDLSFIKELDFNLGALSPNTYNEDFNSMPELFSKQMQDEGHILDYGNSFNQLDMLGITTMHREGYTGKGVTIAVVDGGFSNVQNISAFDSLMLKGQLLATYDFVDREEAVFDDDDHGTNVLSVIGAYSPGNLIGAAYDADFVLLRSEDVPIESRLEEFYWLLAAEFADSIGVDILNTSLGYSVFFDDPLENYSKNDLDGNAALITRAADFAAATGMLIVVSAGNEGNDPWGTISPPADGDSVLTVGGVTALEQYAGFSSVGPSFDGRIKPDVAAQGTSVVISRSNGSFTVANGTSFSAPLITGLAAGVWQAFPNLTNMQLIDTLKTIASQRNSPDNELGYGIPDFSKLRGSVTGLEKVNALNLQVYPMPFQDSFNILFPEQLNEQKVLVEIYDLTGKILFEKEKDILNNVIGLQYREITFLPKGVLLLKISSKSGNAHQTLIKN